MARFSYAYIVNRSKNLFDLSTLNRRQTMNKQTYKTLRRFIRDNGIRYTAQYGIDTGNMAVVQFCDDMVNIMKTVDWLSMRQHFARNEKPAVAFKLTTSHKDIQQHVGVFDSYTWNSGKRQTSFI